MQISSAGTTLPAVPFQFNAVRSYFNPFLQVRGPQIGLGESTTTSHMDNAASNDAATLQMSSPSELSTPKGRSISNARHRSKHKNTPTRPVPTNLSSDVSTPKVTITNACLGFIKSQLFRQDQGTVIDLTVPNFTFDELKAAREALYRNSGTKNYVFKSLNDPSTSNEKARHCTASIIAKMQDLDTTCSHTSFEYTCSASDLFRVAGFMFLNNNDRNTEKRLQIVENKIKSMETTTSLNSTNVQWPLPSVPTSSSGFVAPSRRLDLINNLNKNTAVASPNKRKRSEGFSSDTVLENKSDSSRSHKVLKGKPRSGLGSKPAELFEVFLFNYCEDADPVSVLNYFKSHGVSAVHVRFRCHPNNPDKKFVMKIKFKDDFEKVVLALPEFTGCRVYDPMHRPDPANRPKGFFNNGTRILGPGVSFPSKPLDTAAAVFLQSTAPIDPDQLQRSGIHSGPPPPYSRPTSDLICKQTSVPTTDPMDMSTVHSRTAGASSSTSPAAEMPGTPTSENLAPINSTTVLNSTNSVTTTAASLSTDSTVLSVSNFIKPLVSADSNDKFNFQVGSPVSLNYVSSDHIHK